jgi:hypothetical protein
LQNVLRRGYRREPTPLLEWWRGDVLPEHLKTDVVRPSFPMFCDAILHGALIAMHDHGVAEPIRAPANEVLVVEAKPSPAGSVVVKTGVNLEVFVCPPEKLVATLIKDDGLLDAQELVA